MNIQELKIDTDRLTLEQGFEREVIFNESDEIVSERWIPVIKHRLYKRSADNIFSTNLSHSDGANIESVKPGKKATPKTKTVIENTKPKL